MGSNSKIEWTDATWNPIVGCTKVSEGCKFCYAERLFKRFNSKKEAFEGCAEAEEEFKNLKINTEHLDKPSQWKTPKKIFVCSLSDLFHEALDVKVLDVIIEQMILNKRHTFLILTKRPERMVKIIGEIPASLRKHIWLGISAENQKRLDERMEHLSKINTEVKFVSAEPLLEEISIIKWKDHINWLIVGGESGSQGREMDPEWAMKLKHQCRMTEIPFFFKQMGNHYMSTLGIWSKGNEKDEIPEDLFIREYPVQEIL